MPSLQFEKTDILRPVSNDVYHAKTKRLKKGLYLVQIKPWTERRRIRQNKLYWHWLTLIGEEQGCEKEQVHEQMKEEFLGWKEVITLHGEIKQTLRSTTTLSVNEFWRYMRQIEILAGEMWGMTLPQPDPEDLPKGQNTRQAQGDGNGQEDNSKKQP